ncbi:MAG: hypothetical protein NT001_03365 [Candidatus Woesearchaeota archaeon]|nr:hypothetical protein [Candidatus Woesearchaeota archaeon]
MAENRTLEERCKEGQIPVDEFFQFAVGRRTARTHFLKVKDSYLVLANPIRDDVLDLEEIQELDYTEAGKFLTVKGTTGSVRKNLFIVFDGCFRYLVEGDNLNADNSSIYPILSRYVEQRCSKN